MHTAAVAASVQVAADVLIVRQLRCWHIQGGMLNSKEIGVTKRT
jgi:hypothetical protein